MARIPDEEIERLKREVSRGAAGGGAAASSCEARATTCSACARFTTTASRVLVISPSKNLWHCLGACQAGGRVIDWVMRAEGVSFRHAVELLRAEHPSLAASSSSAGASRSALAPEARGARGAGRAGRASCCGSVVDYYHATLKESPEALEYLQQRGLEHARDDRALPARLREPHARLPAAEEDR